MYGENQLRRSMRACVRVRILKNDFAFNSNGKFVRRFVEILTAYSTVQAHARIHTYIGVSCKKGQIANCVPQSVSYMAIVSPYPASVDFILLERSLSIQYIILVGKYCTSPLVRCFAEFLLICTKILIPFSLSILSASCTRASG